MTHLLILIMVGLGIGGMLMLAARSREHQITLCDLREIEENTVMKLSELASSLAQIEAVLTKVQSEVQALKDGLADADIPAEAQAALDRLSGLADAIDQINPDSNPSP